MDALRAPAPRSTGYSVVLVGSLAFAVGCFLPYVTLREAFTPSLYEMQTMRHTGAGFVGAVLMMFTGVVALGVISSVGIRRPQVWTAAALVAVVVVWTLDEIGFTLGASGLWPTKTVGYWVVLVAIAVVAAGAMMVGISLRTGPPQRPDVDA